MTVSLPNLLTDTFSFMILDRQVYFDKKVIKAELGYYKLPSLTVQPPDERQVDDPTTAATDAVGDTREEVVSEDQPAEKALSKTAPAATESGAGEGAKTSQAGDNGTERKPILGGKRRAVKVKDRDSGTTYDSKSKAGKALASEFGLDPNDSFVWYRIVQLSPDRFEELAG